ncbi:hypothetical protein GCM10017673_37590 [Streptosporangium violaceochromogenes]|nr:hypothetical protein GCM10017673_37590 [Streptosporangium violaceochromogenes]
MDDKFAALGNPPEGVDPGLPRRETRAIEKLRAAAAGAGRARAAHEMTEQANAAAAAHRAEITGLAAVLHEVHGAGKIALARAAGIAVQNLFPPNAVLPRPAQPPEEPQAWKQLRAEAYGYRLQRAKAHAAREVRRDDVVALYQQQEPSRIARELGMVDSLVKGDLKARGVELRPAIKAAGLDDESATLAEIARMLGVDYKWLKDRVRSHQRGGTLPEGAEFRQGSRDGKPRYVPRVIAGWIPAIRQPRRVDHAPKGEKLADLARRFGEPYERVRTAIRVAEQAGDFPTGVRNPDGTFNEEPFMAWWRARGVTLKDLAAELGADYEPLRWRVRTFLNSGSLPDGVRLPSGRWNREGFMAEVWPHVKG